MDGTKLILGLLGLISGASERTQWVYEAGNRIGSWEHFVHGQRSMEWEHELAWPFSQLTRRFFLVGHDQEAKIFYAAI